jgi:hypothetical protein
LVKRGYKQQLLRQLRIEKKEIFQGTQNERQEKLERKNLLMQTTIKNVNLTTATQAYDTENIIRRIKQLLEKKAAVVVTIDHQGKKKEEAPNDVIARELEEKCRQLLDQLKDAARQFQEPRKAKKRRVYYFVHINPEKAPIGLKDFRI